MCGFAGLLTRNGSNVRLARAMAARLAHRGPDDQGHWGDADAGVGLGHQRLSIVDLSTAGHQPMRSADGRYVIAYNGEVYNHAALRREVEEAGGAPSGGWAGHSDTETLLAAIALWGLEGALRTCVGMFALALWDVREQALFLARDRFGEKPLYYGWAGGDFVFGSELKALRAHPGFDNEVDRGALRLLASRAYVPAPLSIYRRIYKLTPGCILRVAVDGWRAPRDTPPVPDEDIGGMAMRRYWSYAEVVRAGLADPVGSEQEALELLEHALAAAIRGQSLADVPVGAFLSGGIDSSLVVALYRKYAPGSVRTFSIGFEDKAYDESGHARAVAKHLGTDHNERIVTAREARDVIPLIPEIYDEPFADSSQIPTHLLSRFAREQVTVALSGDGGDELFGGYNRYSAAARLWSHASRIPAPLRTTGAALLGTIPASVWTGLASLRGGRRPPHYGIKVRKGIRTIAGAASLDDLFESFLDEWAGEPSSVLGSDGRSRLCGFDFDPGVAAPDAVRMMYCDTLSYLPDDILCKVDRAAMAVSLETRVPFLDHRVAALAARIPVGMKIRGGRGKTILRHLLYREAPASLFERPKAGFAIPLGDWLRGPLRDWAEDLLGPRLEQDGYLDARAVRQRWRQHVDGTRDSAQALWAILMFQAWLASR
jgi:asparagine synthase (glutamine-hydrolysing)